MISKSQIQTNCKKARKNNFSYYLMLLSVIAILIVTDTSMTSILAFNLVGKKIVIFAMVLGLYGLIILFLNRRIKADLIFILLCLRIPFFLVQPLIYSGFNESFFANYLIVIIAPIVYQMVILIEVDSNKLLKGLLKYSIIIIIIQLFSVYIESISKSVPVYMFKSNLLIPVGGSNYIAAILLILGIMSLKVFDNKFYVAVSFLGIFLTLSNSGIFTMLLTLIIVFINHRQKVQLKKTMKLLIKALVIVGLLVFVINYTRNFEYVESIFSRYTKMIDSIFNIRSFNNTSTFDISNGRINIFSNSIKMIAERPILGWGLGIVENVEYSGKVHNWVLQGLLNGGLIGLLIYILPLQLAVGKMWKTRKLDYSYYGLLVIFASLLQGLVEPNYFTPTIELLIWLIIGISLKDTKEQ